MTRPYLSELVRLAIPRRMYTQSHVDYAVEVCARVAGMAAEGQLPGYEIVEEPPSLRHFSAKLMPVDHISPPGPR